MKKVGVIGRKPGPNRWHYRGLAALGALGAQEPHLGPRTAPLARPLAPPKYYLFRTAPTQKSVALPVFTPKLVYFRLLHLPFLTNNHI
jgi:hypothetical protein